VGSYVGYPEETLIANWGTPDSTYSTGGKKFLTYNSQRSVYIPGYSPTYTTTYIGNSAYTNSYGGSSGYYVDASCKTTFVVQSSTVVDVSFTGNDCTALPPE